MKDDELDSSQEPSAEEEKPRQEKRKIDARTVVGGVAALGAVSLFLFLSLIVTVFLERKGLATVAALVPILLYATAYRVFSRWERAWEWVAFLAAYFPPLAKLLAEKERRQAIGSVVERIECVVGFYGLKNLFPTGRLLDQRGFPRFRNDFRKALIDSIPDTVSPDNWATALIAGLAQELGWQPETRKVLELLYRERLGQCDSAEWQKFRRDDEDDQALRLLAGALADSRKLPSAAAAWKVQDLVTVLREMDEFSWDLLRDQLHALADLAGQADSYLAFLKENGVALGKDRPSVSELKTIQAKAQEQARRFGEPETWRDVTLLVEVGRAAIGEALKKNAQLAKDAADPVLQRYALLAAILHLWRVSSMTNARGQLCKLLAAQPKDEGVRLVWAFLELKHGFRSEQRPADRPFFSFADLVEGWRSHLGRAATKPYLSDELAELRAILEEGKWVNRLADLLNQAGSQRLKQQIPSSVATSDEKDVAGQVVKQYKLDQRPELLANLIRHVDLETLARNLEAGQFIPYLITFRADHGPLSRLINCLTMPKKVDQAGVVTKYDFRPYTENARIGLVPEGWSFEQFREEFQKDFTKVLEARTKLLRQDPVDLQGIEILVHRFSALGLCAIDSPLSRRVALSNLIDLLVEKLPPEKLVALVQASTAVPLRDYALSASIPDLVGNEATLTTAESNLLEGKDGQIKSELLGELHAANIPQLATKLQQHTIDHNKAAKALAQLLGRYVPQFDGGRSSLIANAYLNGLESLAAA